MLKVDKDLSKGVFLAIRGGGIKSASAIGVLKFLEEAGIEVTSVAGASLGSIVAALIADGHNSKEILELFLMYNKVFTKAAKILGGRGSIIIEETMNKELGHKDFNDLEKPLYINASTGNKPSNVEAVSFSSQKTPDINVGMACRASSSIPYIYGPYKVQTKNQTITFWDGGYSGGNPLIPNTDLPVLYCNFSTALIRKNEQNPTKNWHFTPIYSEMTANFVVKPDLNKIGIFDGILGTKKDMIEVANRGYEEAKKVFTKHL